MKLSQEGARAKMLEMIRESGPHFVNQTRIKVGFPDCQGTLTGTSPGHGYTGPLAMHWWFSGHFNGKRMEIAVCDKPTQPVLITTGIRMGRGTPQIVDWKRAIEDLKEPSSFKPLHSDLAEVSWRNRRNQTFTAEISWQTAAKLGCTYTDLHLTPSPCPDVQAKVTLLNGLWVMEREGILAIGERLIFSAHFSDRYGPILPAEIRAQVIALLRKTLHSAAWRKQHALARELSIEASFHDAVWERLRHLERLLDDRHAATFRREEALREVQEARARIEARLTSPDPSFECPTDPQIYGDGIPDDSTEVTRLTAENTAAMISIDAKIEELSRKVAAAHKGR